MIVLKLKKNYTCPDDIIEHFSCLKRNIRARDILHYRKNSFSLAIVA